MLLTLINTKMPQKCKTGEKKGVNYFIENSWVLISNYMVNYWQNV